LSADAAAPRARLSDDQLQELMTTIGKADSVELKLTVDDAGQREAVRALGLDPLNAQIRQVVFLDTPDLQLSKAGLVARARRVQGKPDDSTIKLRPVQPDQLSPALRATPGFVIEVDAMPGSFVCSGSLTASLKSGAVWSAMRGERPIRKLFSKAQRAFFDAHAPAGITLDDLSILGPIFVLKLKWVPQDFGNRMVAEAWILPDASMTLELSTKTLPRQAFQAAAEARAFLAARGVRSSGGQETKTRRALRLFSKQLTDELSVPSEA
jgi:hypothetical protein